MVSDGDTIYFKDSGEPVTIKAEVEKVIQFSDLTAKKVEKILDKYVKDDGIEENEVKKFFDIFKNKKYCILVFLKKPQETEPFEVNKSGFGMMSAWISLENINQIKV